MAAPRKIWTNFSKGEISPLLEGRPDLVGYNEGASILENVLMLRQAGVTRRPGTRFLAEVKDSDKDTILIPFEAGLNHSVAVEVGSEYMRFYKDKAQLQSVPGVPVEIATPYNDSNIRALHYTQSVDVVFLFHALYRQRRLNRISDLNWSLIDVVHRPPPSFEKDADISDPADLTPVSSGETGGGQGVGGPGTGQPGDGGVGGGGDSGTDGGDGGGGDGGGE